jgi:hypothetical protein
MRGLNSEVSRGEGQPALRRLTTLALAAIVAAASVALG